VTLVAIAVTVTWMAIALIGAVTHDFTGLGIATPPFLIVCGGLFAVRKNGYKNGD